MRGGNDYAQCLVSVCCHICSSMYGHLVLLVSVSPVSCSGCSSTDTTSVKATAAINYVANPAIPSTLQHQQLKRLDVEPRAC